MLILIELNVD